MRHVLPIRAGAGLPHHLQPAGPAVQSGRRAAPGAGRARPRAGSSRWPGCWARSGSSAPGWCTATGLDEMTTTGETQVAEWRDGRRAPVHHHARGGRPAARRAGRPARRRSGRERRRRSATCWPARRGAYRDIVLLNAAAALLVADKVETLREGVDAGRRRDRRRPRQRRAGHAWSRRPTRA